MKRILSFALVTALLSSGACFAADTGGPSDGGGAVSVSIDAIEQIWTDHSPELLKIKSDLASAKKMSDQLSDAADNLSDAVLIDTTGLLDFQFASLESSLEQAKCAYDIAAVQYDRKIQNALLSAKQAFITCWQDELNLTVTQAALSQKQAQLDHYAVGLTRGFLSQKTYDDLQSTAYDLQNNLSGLKTKLDADEITLKSKLGLDLDAALHYTYPDLNADAIGKLMDIDPDADLAKLLSGSVNIKVLQITYDSMSFPSHTYANSSQIHGAYLDLQTAKANTEENFTILYNNLIGQYSDLKNSYRNLADQKDELDRMQEKYDMGYVSGLALSDLKLAYSSMEAAVALKESAVYGTYLSYVNMVAGN